MDSLVLNHLNSNILVEVKPSLLHGVGVFSLFDIIPGVKIFNPWQYFDLIIDVEIEKINKIIFNYIKRFYHHDNRFIRIHLFKNINLNFTNHSFVNHSYNPNIDTNGISLRNIKAGEEITKNYYRNIVFNENKKII